ncbi:MAG: hypothetical protein JNL12_03345 [Planctomycetes bacterium]|nr:hypothetical protein [Planctomycetota bacterium]
MPASPVQPSFVSALRRTAPIVAPAAILTACATAAVCAASSALPFVHASLLLGTGLVGIPLLFVLALGLAMAGLWSLAALLAVPWWILRRPTGLGDLASALFGQWRTLLPGYWRAVRRVDRPVLWGAVLGVPLGTVGFLFCHGLRAG